MANSNTKSFKTTVDAEKRIDPKENYAAYLDKYPILKRKETIISRYNKEKEKYFAEKNGCLEVLGDDFWLGIMGGALLFGIGFAASGIWVVAILLWSCFLILLFANLASDSYVKKRNEAYDRFASFEEEYKELQKVPPFDTNYNYRDNCKIIESTISPKNKRSVFVLRYRVIQIMRKNTCHQYLIIMIVLNKAVII